MMMKIERQLSISQDKKGNEIARVQDLTKDQIKNLNKDKFRKTKSQRNESRLEADVYIILKEDFNEIENNFSKIQSLEEDIQDKDKTIKQLQDDLSAIDEDYQKKIENIKREDNAKIDELNEALHDKDIEIEKVKTRYEKEIGNLKESYQKEINGLDLFDEDKHMKIKDHDDIISNLKLFDEDKHMAISDHEDEVKGITSDHNDEVKGIKDKIVRETIINNDRIHELEKGLTFRGFIRGKYKTPLKDLKEGIDHFQYIAQYSETYENQVLDVKDKGDK